MAWEAVVTNAGNALFARWAGGGTLAILGASAGSDTIESTALLAATAIAGEKQQPAITGCRLVDGGVRYALQFTAADAAYTARQIGIWASLDGGDKTLIAIFQNAEGGIPVESIADMPDYIYEFGAIVEMRNSGDMQVNIDTSALASQKDIQAMVRVDMEQAFSQAEKAQARLNIAACTQQDFSAVIPAAGWSSDAPYSVVVEVPGMLESDIPLVDIIQSGSEDTDAPMREAWALVTRIVAGNDSITAYAAEELPEVEIAIQMKVVR
ncbi:MAG: hypothetical protein IJ466_07365 [Clostridia bacterium]|nr:hypothetical protein [Clostridia bacterium]